MIDHTVVVVTKVLRSSSASYDLILDIDDVVDIVEVNRLLGRRSTGFCFTLFTLTISDRCTNLGQYLWKL